MGPASAGHNLGKSYVLFSGSIQSSTRCSGDKHQSKLLSFFCVFSTEQLSSYVGVFATVFSLS